MKCRGKIKVFAMHLSPICHFARHPPFGKTARKSVEFRAHDPQGEGVALLSFGKLLHDESIAITMPGAPSQSRPALSAMERESLNVRLPKIEAQWRGSDCSG